VGGGSHSFSGSPIRVPQDLYRVVEAKNKQAQTIKTEMWMGIHVQWVRVRVRVQVERVDGGVGWKTCRAGRRDKKPWRRSTWSVRDGSRRFP
jgi:hypothetical protein